MRSETLFEYTHRRTLSTDIISIKDIASEKLTNEYKLPVRNLECIMDCLGRIRLYWSLKRFPYDLSAYCIIECTIIILCWLLLMSNIVN
jgi:hypothetical protein